MAEDQALLGGPGDDSIEMNEQQSSRLSFLQNSDVLRQVTMILVLAICLALAIFLLFWAKEPEMRPLGSMSTEELVETLDYLDLQKINYKVEGSTVLVSSEQYSDIKLQMTRAGLTEPVAAGEEILLNDMGFGVSQNLERERLKLSRERQLANAIMQMKSVNKAQVLLAIPKTNVFARQADKPSATVVVSLRRTNELPQEEVDSIVDMVASAVQGLVPSRVTVTDQHGRLLNSGSQDPLSAQTRKEFEIEQKREREYKDKIDSILIPVLGVGNYTAEVDVTMDFTSVEQTQKRFNPDLPAVRSELSVEDNSSGNGSIGIPGALTNQPPMDSDMPETSADARTSSSSGRSHKELTRNYELDTTVSHTRQQVGVVRRLSVSVAIDYLSGSGADGQVTREAREPAAINDIRRLLQGGIGFDLTRGDMLEVVSVPFTRPDLLAESDLPVWEQTWFWRAVRVGASVLVLIVLILAVIRPMLKRLMNGPEETDDLDLDLDAAMSAYDGGGDDLLSTDMESVDFGIRDGQLNLPDLHRDEDLLKAVRALVANEPDLAAMVIKDWVTNDG
jgi:flagellar M-ring protein FliF